MENRVARRNKILKITALLGLFLLMFGVSYALFNVVLSGTKKSKLTSAKLSLKITDLEGNEETEGYGINLNEAYPMTNEEGLQLESYEFKVVNDGTIDAYYKLNIKELTITDMPAKAVRYNLIEDGETITIEPKLLSETVLTKTSTNENLYQIDTDIIKVGEEKTYKLNIWIDYEATKEEASGKIFGANIELNASQITSTTNVFKEGTVAYKIYQNETIQGRSSETKLLYAFDETKETSGLYTYPDMFGGTTYYYRGIEVNNYVSFGGLTWRIVRILEDGSVRLILADRMDESAYIYNSKNGNSSDAKYINSEIKTTVDNWYNTNLVNYDKYIKTSTYCSDMREDSTNDFANYLFSNGSTNVYGIYARGTYNHEIDSVNNPQDFYTSTALKPDLSCNDDDKLESKVALISADEAILAGGGYKKRGSYLGISKSFWTLSPAVFNNTAQVVYLGSSGGLSYYNIGVTGVIRPVITLKSTATITSGSGTSADPYTIG
ncbi:MAG: hypothetical protein ACI4OT_00900 [Bacilli bacterium]